MEGFGHYGRYLIGIEAGEPSVHTVRIKRYRCISCRHTHALLSSCLVPYRSYSLRFILTVLYHYFCKRGTVEQICRLTDRVENGRTRRDNGMSIRYGREEKADVH